jgi:hypothetical protein
MSHFMLAQRAPGVDSDESARAIRLLYSFNYLEGRPFVCPGSNDVAQGPTPRDEHLTVATDLSYGYTTRGHTTNVISSWLLFADKARYVSELTDRPERSGNMAGNHPDCMNAVCQDGHTIRITPENDCINTHTIANTTWPGGFLGVLPD